MRVGYRRWRNARWQKRIGEDLRTADSRQKGLHACRLDHLRVSAEIDPPSAQVRVLVECDLKGRSGPVPLGGWPLGDARTIAKIRMAGGEPIQLLDEVQPADVAAAVAQVDSPA